MTIATVATPLTKGTLYYNKYNLLRQIGKGSFGEVWLAQDQAVNHPYAIKILNPGIAIDERLREAQIGHMFSHNNLVKVHQADVTVDGKVIIAMDYLSDGSVTSLANPSNFLPLPVAHRIIVDMLQGLEHLHLHSFFHNDVKPQNILRGPQGQAKLTDYGIVGVSPSGGPVQPSAWYVLHAAPETTAGHGIEARTDVFQTGLTLFRLLVGLGSLEEKFNLMSQDAYANAIACGTLITRADFPAYIPNSVCRIVMACIDANPRNRFQSALGMRRALEKISFSGYWTVSATGQLVGNDSRNTYRFEYGAASGSNAFLSAYKTNRSSGRETRVSQFTINNISNVEAKRAMNAFQKAVVDGKLR